MISIFASQASWAPSVKLPAPWPCCRPHTGAPGKNGGFHQQLVGGLEHGFYFSMFQTTNQFLDVWRKTIGKLSENGD